MKIYKVDLDYENYLFDKNYNSEDKAYKKINQSFEYVFFIVNKENCLLENQRNYSAQYLSHLKSRGFVIPQLTTEAGVNWWGSRQDLILEQKLNSKLTSARLAKEKNLGMFNGLVTDKLDEIISHIEKSNISEWLIKKPHSFSGIGHYYFSKESINLETLKKVVGEVVILEPVYKRLFDIGTTFEFNGKDFKRKFMVENFNSSNGRFKGAMAAKNIGVFKELIQKKYDYDLSKLDQITDEIFLNYKMLGATSNVQIDSFVYEENGELKLYPLVEVNYRKTMGLVAQSLIDHHPEAQFIEWKIYGKGDQGEKPKDWFEFSPEDSPFKNFYKSFS